MSVKICLHGCKPCALVRAGETSLNVIFLAPQRSNITILCTVHILCSVLFSLRILPPGNSYFGIFSTSLRASKDFFLRTRSFPRRRPAPSRTPRVLDLPSRSILSSRPRSPEVPSVRRLLHVCRGVHDLPRLLHLRPGHQEAAPALQQLRDPAQHGLRVSKGHNVI